MYLIAILSDFWGQGPVMYVRMCVDTMSVSVRYMLH